MEEKNIRQTLRQYLLGNAEEKSINAVDSWYASFDKEDTPPLSAGEAMATKQEIWDKISPVLTEQKKTGRIHWLWKAAASVVLLAGSGAVLYKLLSKNKAADSALAWTTIKTGVGEKRAIVLQDSTRVTLDAGTTIRVQNDFSQDRRVDLVDGEAFFDVATDAAHPFIVQSDDLTTTVLGTSFVVSAYKALHNVNVGVVSGKVRVNSGGNMLSELTKNEELLYDKGRRHFRKTALDESMTAWMDGRLLLNDLSFGEMNAIVRKNFGIDVI
ncbi:MAG: FecR domain-containing protein, partial [Bacteroidetes bacterium]|nr:FecR domain-containing protein [Bacteroidota bacterium]